MNEQRDELAFDNPPVIETILGVQFAPIPNFTSAYLGWYWREFLGSSWVKTLDAMTLPDQFEQFGEPAWRQRVLQLATAMLVPGPSRLQFINGDDDRVIQIQNTRFIYNWRRRGSVYPTFKSLYPEFMDRLEQFRTFLRVAALGDITPNQWEVTYINHIPKGQLWETSDDWHEILPGLIHPPRHLDETRLGSETGEWHFEIQPQRGRLHVTVQHGRQEDGSEVLVLQSTARGPMNANSSESGLESGLKLGHRVTVETFAGISSESAQRHWGKIQT